MSTLELWAGIECTVNRVGDTYFDQLKFSRHYERPEDLDHFAQLGIKRIRYPVLWERVAPENLSECSWDFSDKSLGRIQQLGIKPIVGLLHHGSGPSHTNLADPDFAEKLACYARLVAERYPWVDAFTPINEPLTTARFSGIYGFWYPHSRRNRSFCRMLVNQYRAIVLAMKAIREVNPQATLIQTEDLGKASGVERLTYQVEFENQRRWLTYDFLCGKIKKFHPLYEYLTGWGGLTEQDVEWFQENSCPPDIIGINHYLTSNRYLDTRVRFYPDCYIGGNTRHRYADIEAARVKGAPDATHQDLLQETWDRYHLPLAITEVHLDSFREDQMRWMQTAWKDSLLLKKGGVDVRAVTAWSLLGNFEWNSLVTHLNGYYEPGVFDLRGTLPRPTALAKQIKMLATTGEFSHPVLASQERPGRPQLATAENFEEREEKGKSSSRPRTRPLLITGGRGTLGSALHRVCNQRNLLNYVMARSALDISSEADVEKVLDELQPWAVINAAGYVRVDRAEHEPEICFRENVVGPRVLARKCVERGIHLVTFSSDLVFDGSASLPYTEDHPVSPLNVYGRSKVEAEQSIMSIHPNALIVRTSAFFGPWDEHNFVFKCLKRLKEGHSFEAVSDVTVSPTYVPDLAHWTLNLLLDEESGIWHLSNQSQITWADFAKTAASMAKLDVDKIVTTTLSNMKFPAARPSFSALGSRRGGLLPPLAETLARFFLELEVGGFV